MTTHHKENWTDDTFNLTIYANGNFKTEDFRGRIIHTIKFKDEVLGLVYGVHENGYPEDLFEITVNEHNGTWYGEEFGVGRDGLTAAEAVAKLAYNI